MSACPHEFARAISWFNIGSNVWIVRLKSLAGMNTFPIHLDQEFDSMEWGNFRPIESSEVKYKMIEIVINGRRGSRSPPALVLGKDSEDGIGDRATAATHHWLECSEVLARLL